MNGRRVGIATALVMVVVGTAACASTQSPASHHEPTVRDYFPLHSGAAWSFDSTETDRTAPPGLVTMHVVRDDGAGGFYMQQGHGSPALYEYAEGGLTRNGERVLSGPIAAGTRWQGRSHDNYVIQAVGLTRTVTAGTFHDVIQVVHTAGDATLRNGTEYRETYYYAPAVGPIEAELPILVGEGDVRRFHLTLRGYTLNGDL